MESFDQNTRHAMEEEFKQENRKSSIAGIVPFLLSALAIIIVASALYLSHISLRNYIFNLEHQKLKGIVSSTSETIALFLREHMESLESLAISKELLDEIYSLSKESSPSSLPMMENFFQVHIDDIISLNLTNAAGEVVYRETAKWRQITDPENIFKRDIASASTDIYEDRISNIFFNESGEPVFTLTVPIMDKRKVVGFLQAEVSVKEISEMFVIPSVFGEIGYVWMMDENGLLVSFPYLENPYGKQALDAVKSAAPDTDLSDFELLLEKMRSGKSGSMEYGFVDLQDKNKKPVTMIAEYAKFGSEVSWTLAAVENKNQFVMQVRKNFYYTGAIFIVFVLLFGAGSYFMNKLREQRNNLETEKKFLGIIADTASQLHEREAQFRLAFEVATDAIIWHDSETGIITNCNTATEELIGDHRSTILKKHIKIIFPENSTDEFMQELSASIEKDGEADFEAEIVDVSKKIVPVHITASETMISERKITQSIIRDITDLKKSEEVLQEYNNILSQRVRELNCLYGISRLMENKNLMLEDVYNKTVSLIPLSWQYPGDSSAKLVIDGKEYQSNNFQETKWKISSSVYYMSEPIGTLEVCYLHEKPKSDHGPFTNEEVALLNTISGRLGLLIEKKRAEEKAEYLSSHDALTGLPNRQDFLDKLNWSIEYAKRYGGERAVLFIDLDKFKKVNDTYGHEAGDMVLVEAANRLKAALRTVDHVCRLGGDEFTVTLASPGNHNAEIVAQKIFETISKPFYFNGTTIDFVTPSIGISIYPIDGDDVATLLRKADNAMYEAKKTRKSYVLYKDMKIS